MDLGIVVMIGSDGLTPQAVGRACEERGFESLFWAEHTHIPVRSRRADGASTRWYADTYDPFTALSAAAAVTSTLKLGTGVCLVIERDPITLAKEVASLDRLSGGRFLFGVGAGWNREEMADHGTDPRTRMALLADRVRAMQEIWAKDEASYHGPFVDFDPLWSWPKPAQRPGPPVLVAGNGPGSEDRVLDFGDQWMPQSGPFADVAEFRRRVAALRQRAQDAGREPIPVTVFGVPPDRALLAEFAEAGADRCLLPLTSLDASETMSKLDDWAALRSESSRLPRSARPRQCETPAVHPVASGQAPARARADHPPSPVCSPAMASIQPSRSIGYAHGCRDQRSPRSATRIRERERPDRRIRRRSRPGPWCRGRGADRQIWRGGLRVAVARSDQRTLCTK